MVTREQALGAWDDRIRRSVVEAGLDPRSVLASEYEWIGHDKVSVVVMDPQTRKRQFRAIIDLLPDDIDWSTPRKVWLLEVHSWGAGDVLGVYSSHELAREAMLDEHGKYVEYVADYIGVDPNEEDEEYLCRVESDPTLCDRGVMEINERTVDA